ncbi:HAMP domain-containing sensor histidine kinase [Chitinibacter tainanensis]|uniref:HAMP domain-containing sensor histidine kinase n=1 Tax=Chitinibacter tainanensis TaxID=230667 RepID=UPI002356D4D9|nr:HAMP domain-containing sensor histidine kinase [Chitinibacter tainanensis]
MSPARWSRALRNPFTRWAIALPLVMSVVITGFGALAFRETQQALLGEFHTALREEVTVLELIYREQGFKALQTAINLRASQRGSQRVYLLTTAQGQYVAGNLHHWPRHVLVKDESSAVFEDPASGETIAAEVFLLYGDYRLLVGRRAIYEQVGNHLILNYLWLGVLMFAASIIAGLTLSRLIRRRLATIRQTAQAIRIGQQGSRIPLSGSDDELEGVIKELNALLDQQEKLLAYSRQTSAAIAHDLRQPLSLLRGKLLELSEAQPADLAIKDAALAQLEQIQALFSAILRLGRIESGAQALHAERSDLAVLAGDVVELYQPLLEDAGLTISLVQPQPVQVAVDRELVFAALSNLIENALRYAQSDIELHVGERWICVRDFGPGVSEAELARLCEPFYKTEASRQDTSEQGGHGLGLALVKAIAELHGGHLQLQRGEPGLAITLHFP